MSSQDDEDDFVPHEEHDDHGGEHGEPWLVSYADLMTLLFGFFVLMYSFAAAKNEAQGSDGTIAMRAELAQFFGGEYINPLKGADKKFKDAIASSENISEDVKAGIKNLVIKVTPEGIEVTFSSTALFEPGSAILARDSRLVLGEFVKIVADKKDQYKVRVEGYTDASPISSEKFPSNWELSAARATQVIRMFEGNGFNPNKLTAVGFGASRPLAPNYDENGQYIPENMNKNRRVVIYVRQTFEVPSEASDDKSSKKVTMDLPKADN